MIVRNAHYLLYRVAILTRWIVHILACVYSSLDLVKNRVGVMNPEMRKSFIGTILVGLIEKTPDAKVNIWTSRI